tara:strand:- start:1375 stop:1794 length:420 start_codon:yes stop_codon:yes gene_type:complete
VIKKKDLSEVDKKVWEDYTKNPSDIYDKERDTLKKKNTNDRFKFDLHGYSLNDANNKVKEVIVSCSDAKYKELLLITGKGLHSENEKDIFASQDLGKLRHSVPEFIKSNQELNKLIISIDEAEPKDGGEGALLIKLKKL